MPRPTVVTAACTAVLTVFLSLPASAGMDTYPRQPGLVITGYAFDVTLTDANDEITVQDTVQARIVTPGLPVLELDLCERRAQPRTERLANGIHDPCAGPASAAAADRGMTVTAVTSAGQPLPFQHANDRLRITLPQGSSAGDRVQLTVSYHGTPATGLLVANNKYGDRGFFSDSWPNKARNFLATIDHPHAKAPVTMSVTAPRRYQVIGNGRLTEEVDLPDDRRRTTWKESHPISTWLIALGVAPFAVDHFGDYRGVALSSWVFPRDRDASVKAFATFTEPILEFFSSRIGPYPYEKLAHIEANGVSGGMELASSIFYGYGPQGPGRQLIAHEMAHQWFGDSATERDWDDVWLSEGFATYFALLYQEFADGRDLFLEGVRRSKDEAVRFALANPDSTILHHNLADHSQVIANNAQIYQGGAQVLHNIRGVVGSDVFWAGIRLYYSRFQHATATTGDFRRAMEEACATAEDTCPVEGRNLTWLFNELLTRGGVLQVAGSWRYDAIQRQVVVTLEQTQSSGLYRMPIEVTMTSMSTPAGGRGGQTPQTVRTTRVVQLTGQRETLTFPSDTEPTGVDLDPNAWVMMRATFERR